MTSKSPDTPSEDSAPDTPADVHEEARPLAAEPEHRGLSLFFLFDYAATVNPHVDFDALIRLLGPAVGPELEETMRSYQQLLVQKNIERGFEMALGRWRAQLQRQITRRFGTLPDAWATRIAGASADDLDRWGDRLLDVSSPDELFADI